MTMWKVVGTLKKDNLKKKGQYKNQFNYIHISDPISTFLAQLGNWIDNT